MKKTQPVFAWDNWFIRIDLLTTHRKRQMFHFVLHSYLIGVFSYGILMLIVYLANKKIEKLDWKVTF